MTVNLEITPLGYADIAYTACASKIENAFKSKSSYISSISTLLQSGSCPASTGLNVNRTVDSSFICLGYEGAQYKSADNKTHCGKQTFRVLMMFVNSPFQYKFYNSLL